MGQKTELDLLPSSSHAEQQPSKKSRLLRLFVVASITWAVIASFRVCHLYVGDKNTETISEDAPQCPQSSALIPEKHTDLWDDLGQLIATDAFEGRAAEWLGGAVRVPTESYDDMGEVGQDPRWEILSSIHSYLLAAYPLVHAELELKKVNTYGLLYTWQGSNASLKPILMAAHQDVVPVDRTSLDAWTHPPFSGYFDGTNIWGRGSSDDKSGLIGTLSAVELLLEKGFKPTRTVVIAFGFDEEIGGHRGAGELYKVIEETYGTDSFGFIIDEGGGFTEQYGSVFASPGIAEKGAVNVRIDVASPGGHSSVPPAHTSIGILSRLLVQYEDNPFEVHISRKSPIYGALQCFAEHGNTISSDLREAIKRSAHSDKALLELEDTLFEDPVYKSLIGTTQAIDLIQGGVKSNALPEQAWAIVNHRVSTESSVEATKKRDAELLVELADKFNLTYTAFGKSISEEGAASKGSLTLSNTNVLDPAPVTPTIGKHATAYQLLSGTIKATFNAHRSLTGDDNIAVSPGMPTGNTDTKFYWSLSPHIFRYTHHNYGNDTNPLGSGVHTVNEVITVDAVLETIRFFVTLILNADESTTL